MKVFKKILYWFLIALLIITILGMLMGLLPDPLFKIGTDGFFIIIVLTIAFLIGKLLKFWDEL